MILDLVWLLLSSTLLPLLTMLPVVAMTLPGATAIHDTLCRVNTLLPVLGPLGMLLTMLAALPVFLGIRALLVMWNAAKP